MASFLEPIKNIFSSGHKGATLGIDIGSASIKVVLVEKVDEKAVLRNYGEIALGPYSGTDLGRATVLSADKLSEAVKDLLK